MSLSLAGPGISGYSHDTEKAGPSLAQCLEQAKEVIPSKQHQETPVYLGATAGMRLLRYCRVCPLVLHHCAWDHHGCSVGASCAKSLEMLPAHTLPRYPLLPLASLSPESPRALPLLAQQVHFHSLQPSVISSTHMQRRDTRRVAVPKQMLRGCSDIPHTKGMLRHSPQSGIKPDPGFLSPTKWEYATPHIP